MPKVYHVVQLPLFPSKVCSICGKEKLLINDFYKARNSYYPYCKICHNEKSKDYAATHPEQTRQANRNYRKRHPERAKQQSRNNHAANREQERQYNLEYHNANREQIRKQQREYCSTHRETRLRQERAWRKANPLKKLEQFMRYHARKKTTSVGTVSYERILERDGMHCYICERAILPHHKIDFDHVIPLSREGSHTEENIKPTHHICNRRKYNRLLSEMDTHQRRGVTE